MNVTRIALTNVLILLATASSVRGAPTITASGEFGPEYDTNARRLARDEDPRGSALLRLSGEVTGLFRLTDKQVLRLNYGGGGKLFFEESDANELVQRVGGNWSIGVLKSTWGNGTVGAFAD